VLSQGKKGVVASILVIEDSEGQRAEVRAALEESGLFEHVLEASDGIRGLKLMLSESVDLVICDLEMPGIDGEKLLRMKPSASGGEVPIPFLVLTAMIDPERRARLLREGASDAISKPFHAADLIARVGLHLDLVRTQRELLAKNRELERLSNTDPLTGLPNRRRLDEAILAELARSRRTGLPFAVVLIDIDEFKQVNDRHGHGVGDAVLNRVADALTSVTRETDCSGRFGGDEFLAVLDHNDAAGAEVYAERLRQSVSESKIALEGGHEVSVTLSIGIAEWQPEVETPERLIARADEALYAAKASGRDCVCVYSESSGDSD
jgi:diguanylate cyclase (GGDEF)-like protein